MYRYIAIFFIVTGMNIIPFFMPATWTVLTFLSLAFDIPFLPLALIGAVAAAIGRVILARLSRIIIRQQFLSHKTIRNIDYLKSYLEKRRHVAFIIFLSYAFTPLPTNQLFIAYGLTNLPLSLLAIPFFIGRVTSYLFLIIAANRAADAFFPESWSSALGTYFIVVQLLSVATVYLFTKINWKKLIHGHLRHLFT